METFSPLLAICAGNSPVTEGQWRGVLMFSLPESTLEETITRLVIWDAKLSIMTSLYWPRKPKIVPNLMRMVCFTYTVETLYSKIYYSKYFIELHIGKSTQYVALWTHKRHPYLALSGELWSVFYEYVNRNWSCYRGFLLYNITRAKAMAAQFSSDCRCWQWVEHRTNHYSETTWG